MRQAMNNIEKEGEETWSAGKTQVERGISQLKNMNQEDIAEMASNVTSRVREVSTDVYQNSVSFVKRHPVGSAIGFAAFCFLAGAVTARARR